jgi:hypothetical protein
MLLPIMTPPTITAVGRSGMRARTLVSLTLAIAGSLASPAYADVVIDGKIEAVYADPSDVVVQLDQAGDCSKFIVGVTEVGHVNKHGPKPSSKFFHIQRAKTNFKEMTAVVLTALAAGKTLSFFVETCDGDRNIVSHVRVNN